MPNLTERPARLSHRRRRGGFTVVEVAFVGSITAILIALLLPALGHANHMARTAVGLSNLAQIARGLRLYAVDHSNTLPLGSFRDVDALDPDASETDWTVMVKHYEGRGGDTIMTESTADDAYRLFRCPNASTPKEGRTHYSVHPVLIPDRSPTAKPRHPLYKLTWMHRPSEIIMVMDGAQRPVVKTDADGEPIPPSYSAFMTTTDLKDSANNKVIENVFAEYDKDASDNNAAITKGPNNDDGGDANGTIRWRQEGDRAANFVFGDGHAATLRPDEVTNRNIRVDR